jgi:RNA recognition motif-containing protein
MSSKLFVGGLPWVTDDAELRKAFEPYGSVVDAKVVLDRDTGKSRGFGFITFTSEDQAKKAVSAMDGNSVGGRRITVREAQDGPQRRGPPDPHRGPPRPDGPREYPPPTRESAAPRPGGYAPDRGERRFPTDRPERRDDDRAAPRRPEIDRGFGADYRADDWGDSRPRRDNKKRTRRGDDDQDDW